MGLLALFVAADVRSEEASPFLVQEGVAQSQIVVPPNPPRTVKMAAEELQIYLKKLSGAEVKIVTTPDDKLLNIYVGASDLTEKLGVESKGLRNGAFRVVSGDRWLALVGGDKDYVQKEPWGRKGNDPAEVDRVNAEWDKITGDHFGNPYLSIWRKYDATGTGMWEFDLDNAGSFNAVNWFLREQGVRWYLPGPLGEIVPEKKTIALPKVNRTVTPDFALRNLYQMGGNFFSSRRDEILWQLRLGTNQAQDIISFGPNVAVSHGIKWSVSRDEIKKSKPELYKLVGGQRQTDAGVPCLSSDELVQRNVKYLQKMFDTYDIPMLSVMPTDGFTGLCQCEKCAGKDTPDRGRLGSLSDYVWEYVVKVANEIAKTHPDKKIHCLAYTTYLDPPLKIDKLPPNVVVGIAQNRSAFHSPEWRDYFRKAREEWGKKITSGVPLYQYEYYLQDHPTRPWSGTPVSYSHLIVDDLRSLKGISMGDYAEVYRGGINPINLLNVYVTARFYWDVNQDLEKMLDEYFTLFYGPAEKPMREYYALAEEKWRDFSAADIEKLNSLLEAGLAAAGDSVYGQRITLLKESVKAGLDRVYALKKEPDSLRLGFLDEAGIDPTANMDALPSWSLKEIIRGQAEPAGATTVSLGWTGRDLFIRAVCEEPDMGSIRCLAEQTDDASIFRDDAVEIVVQVPERGFYGFVINSAGVFADQDLGKQGLDGLGWASGLKVKTFREDKRWIVEASIPAAALRGAVPTVSAPWLVNVGRVRQRGGERQLSSLSPTAQPALAVKDRMVKIYYPDQK